MVYALTDCETLARTLYGEARGEYTHKNGGLSALIAVGNVIMNRLRFPKRFGVSVRDVCLQRLQFSCWNMNDPNRALLEKITACDEIFKICLEVSENLLNQKWPDLTKGSDHYHAAYVTPFWVQGKKPRVQIGQHIFYKLLE